MASTNSENLEKSPGFGNQDFDLVFSPIHLQQFLLPYPLNSNPKGYVLVVNNAIFDGYNDGYREGSSYDKERLVQLFNHLGFVVYDLENLSANDLWDNIELFQQRFVDEPADCCIVCVMSHGVEGNYVLTSDCKWINIKMDILEKFSNDNCPQLKGKPKIFFFQCCRGDYTDRGVSVSSDSDETDSGSIDIHYERSLSKGSSFLEDMLVCYATHDGFFAYRQPSEGTWYIQLLCSIFKEYADKLDICDMLNLLTSVMIAKVGDGGEKQICPFTNYGFSKKLYLV